MAENNGYIHIDLSLSFAELREFSQVTTYLLSRLADSSSINWQEYAALLERKDRPVEGAGWLLANMRALIDAVKADVGEGETEADF